MLLNEETKPNHLTDLKYEMFCYKLIDIWIWIMKLFCIIFQFWWDQMKFSNVLHYLKLIEPVNICLIIPYGEYFKKKKKKNASEGTHNNGNQ